MKIGVLLLLVFFLTGCDEEKILFEGKTEEEIFFTVTENQIILDWGEQNFEYELEIYTIRMIDDKLQVIYYYEKEEEDEDITVHKQVKRYYDADNVATVELKKFEPFVQHYPEDEITGQTDEGIDYVVEQQRVYLDWGQQSTSGYILRIKRILLEDETLRVYYFAKVPTSESAPAEMMMHPRAQRGFQLGDFHEVEFYNTYEE